MTFANKGSHPSGQFRLVWKLVVEDGEIDRAWRGGVVVLDDAAPTLSEVVDTLTRHGLILIRGGIGVTLEVNVVDDGVDSGSLQIPLEARRAAVEATVEREEVFA